MPENDPKSTQNLHWLASAIPAYGDEASCWSASELREMLAHQLDVPLRPDLEKVSAEALNRFDQHGGSATLTLRQLLSDPHPSAALLGVIKDFSKRAILLPEGAMPESLGAAVYYASLSCAWIRCQSRIHSLDDAMLRNGLQWVLDQEWMDEAIRQLASEHLKQL